MNSDSTRKRRTRGHIIADLSVNYVERLILQCGWTAQRMTADYGIDLLMTTFDADGLIENGLIRFQLKASDSPKVLSRSNAIAIQLDWRDVVYWLNEQMPVILVVYDGQRDRAWWLYLQRELRIATKDRNRLRVGHLTVRVPLTSEVTTEATRAFAGFRDAMLREREALDI